MFGTVEYFMDYFKTCIMNNFSGNNRFMLPFYYEEQLEEIAMRTGLSEEKEFFSSNLERAYKLIMEELFGDGRKKIGSE